MAKAKWTAGRPTVAVDASGTVTASVPLLDAGVKACTLQFVMTADRVLTVYCFNEAGAAGLSDFRAWEEQK